ncbi:MAG: PAS domain S-box protein [Candidatus Tectomicrobia bacterium]
MIDDQNALLREPSELEHLYRVAPVGLCLTDTDHRFIRINQKLAEINGKTVAEHLGRTIQEVIPDIAPQIESIFRRVIDSGEPILDHEIHGSTAARPGEVRIFLGDHYPLSSDDGQVRYVSTLVRDITERRQLEENLAASEALYRSLVEAAPQTIWQGEADGAVSYINKAWEKLTGMSEKDALGRGWVEALHPDDAPGLLAKWERAYKSGAPYSGECRFRAKDGSYRTVDFVGAPVRDASGRVIRWVGINTDITDRKTAEEGLRKAQEQLERRIDERTWQLTESIVALSTEISNRTEAEKKAQESESQLRLLLESTGAIPWKADARTWMFTYVGPKAEELLGYPLHKWYEKDFWPQHLHPDDRDDTVDFCLESSRRCENYEFEYRMISADGRDVWLHDIVNVVSSNGEPQTLQGFMIDVTERKRAEYEVRQRRADLAHFGRISTMGELTAAITHELNQPLAAIAANIGAAQRFMKSGKLNEIGSILEDIAADDRRAAEIIRRLRGLMRRREIRMETLDLNEMIQETLALVHSDFVIKRVTIEKDVERDLPIVQGDRVQVQQVLLNLLLNARDAVEGLESGRQRIRVRTGSSGEQGVQIAVSDSGIGIAEEKKEEIFRPFFSTKKEGLGMGLAINRTIIEAHGGRLWAENNPDEGATFYFVLPVSGA